MEKTSVLFEQGVIRGICDSHVHLFMPGIFPYDQERRYTPASATLGELVAHNETLGVAYTVLVQPSCYGTDNRALCHGLEKLGPGKARGVVVIDTDHVTDEDLKELHLKGVRGIRLNLSVSDQGDLARISREIHQVAERINPLGWHIQIFASPAQLALLLPLLHSSKIPIVLDHFAGGASVADQVTELLRRPNVWVKLSAPRRVSRVPDYADLETVVAQYINAAPERLVWASDWPHTGGDGHRTGNKNEIESFAVVNDMKDLCRLAQWINNDEQLSRILTTNAYALYDF